MSGESSAFCSGVCAVGDTFSPKWPRRSQALSLKRSIKHVFSPSDAPRSANNKTRQQRLMSAIGGAPNLLHAPEAERLVESLERTPLVEIGNSKWMRQHSAIERLNVQAHINAQMNADPFVMEACITFEKMPVLVHELLAAEQWSDKVFPRIKGQIPAENSMKGYYILYHEAAIVNMLEVFFYHDYAIQAVGDSLLDLVDYLARRVSELVATSMRRRRKKRRRKTTEGGEDSTTRAEETTEESVESALQRQREDVRFRVGVTCVTLVRYLAENITKVPLMVMTRMLETHDFMVSLVPLIENPPWTRRKDDGTWEKYVDHQWNKVEPEDLLQLTRTEAQVWLALHALMMEPECRKKYHMHSARKGTLVRVRKYLNEILVDQLPPLTDIQRYLDELAVMDPPAPTATASSGLLLETVPEVAEAIARDALLHATEVGAVPAGGSLGEEASWDGVAKLCRQTAFSVPDSEDEAIREMASLYGEDAFEHIADPASASRALSQAEERTTSDRRQPGIEVLD